jgi:RNA polymerase sigma-70 factor (ECF subfamily)
MRKVMKRVPVAEDWVGIVELQKDVERTLGQRCPDRHELDDLVQETMIKAARSRPTLGDPQRLRAWVLRIAWNVFRDHVRRQARSRPLHISPDEMEGIEALQSAADDSRVSFALQGTGLIYESDELLVVLDCLISELSPEEQRIYRAFYHEGLGCEPIAERLGMSTQSVKMRLFRMRRKLGRRITRRAPQVLSGVARAMGAVA